MITRADLVFGRDTGPSVLVVARSRAAPARRPRAPRRRTSRRRAAAAAAVVAFDPIAAHGRPRLQGGQAARRRRVRDRRTCRRCSSAQRRQHHALGAGGRPHALPPARAAQAAQPDVGGKLGVGKDLLLVFLAVIADLDVLLRRGRLRAAAPGGPRGPAAGPWRPARARAAAATRRGGHAPRCCGAGCDGRGCIGWRTAGCAGAGAGAGAGGRSVANLRRGGGRRRACSPAATERPSCSRAAAC